jgi:hypothetical protein
MHLEAAMRARAEASSRIQRRGGARSARLAAASLLAALALASQARAGIPECNNLRLEDVTSGGCELRGSASCSASCDRLGIYKKACATKLQTVCRQDCTFSAQPTCTDSCTESCKSDCDRGLSITCQHNCFGECNGSCDTKCEGAADQAQCRASCEATCDGECDIRCQPVIDAGCYTHCIECCGGSCTAQANMDCQTTCQDEEFETCEHELEIDCSGSCDVEGALFCNGEYMLSGPDLPGCIQALIAQGTLDANVQAQGQLSLGNKPSVGCSFGVPSVIGGGSFWFALLALAGLRRRRSRAER